MEETASRIAYIWNDEAPVGFVMNHGLGFLRLSFPVELLLKSPAYGVFVIFKCAVSIMVIRSLRRKGTKSHQKMCAHAIIAFTAIQALFEPDFGSAYRHFMIVLPFVYLLYVANWLTSRRPSNPGRGNETPALG
jgi:hypothetical protein